MKNKAHRKGQVKRAKKQNVYLIEHLEFGKTYEEIAEKWGESSRNVDSSINRGVWHLAAYRLPNNVKKAAQVLRKWGAPQENILEILTILLSPPDSNVLDVISSLGVMISQKQIASRKGISN
jgi:hypothetical protein